MYEFVVLLETSICTVPCIHSFMTYQHFCPGLGGYSLYQALTYSTLYSSNFFFPLVEQQGKGWEVPKRTSYHADLGVREYPTSFAKHVRSTMDVTMTLKKLRTTRPCEEEKDKKKRRMHATDGTRG
jgi:hypothetical protein